ncbi:MAG: trigger factor [Propionibacteriaceae bacterium]|jgi:trigger factor|nr:trigger factor [Propionibacteriaceae bacterium]
MSHQHSTTLLLAAAVAAFAVTLAGCDGKPDATDSASASESASAAATAEASAAAAYDYSTGLDENGFYTGITAKDLVELPDYKAFPVPASEAEVTDEDLQTDIDSLLSGYSTSTQVTDRAVEDGDSVNIDYVGSINGLAFDGGSTDGAGTDVTAGSTDYIDDFLTQIIGHKPGETFDVNVTFPDPYTSSPDLAGKDATFVTTINYITETTTPELTDEFVAENLTADYGWTTVEEMKDGLRADLRKTQVQDYIYSYLTTDVTVSEVPEALLENGRQAATARYQAYADSYGMDLDTFIQTYVGYESMQALLDDSEADNVTSVKFSLIVQAIAEDAPISVTEDDVAAYFLEQMGSADYSSYETSYGLPYLKQAALSQKVMDYLYDHAVIS